MKVPDREQLPHTYQTGGDTVKVLFVEKGHAKTIKTTLEQNGEINKDFRMVPVRHGKWNDTIAIPILEMKQDFYVSLGGVVGDGTAFCPYSTSLLGNHAGRTARLTPNNQDSGNNVKSLVEQALLRTAEQNGLWKPQDDDYDDVSTVALLSRIREMDSSICPKKLECLGDDKTLVLQRKAFSLDEPLFRVFLESIGCGHDKDSQQEFVSNLWTSLAWTHKSPRVVRRGEIAPSSGIRESNYRLLWPFEGVPETTGA